MKRVQHFSPGRISMRCGRVAVRTTTSPWCASQSREAHAFAELFARLTLPSPSAVDLANDDVPAGHRVTLSFFPAPAACRALLAAVARWSAQKTGVKQARSSGSVLGRVAGASVCLISRGAHAVMAQPSMCRNCRMVRSLRPAIPSTIERCLTPWEMLNMLLPQTGVKSECDRLGIITGTSWFSAPVGLSAFALWERCV
jgi:hypothetical protein